MSKDQPTPMTDKAEREGNKAMSLIGNLRVVLEHARQLERELAEWKGRAERVIKERERLGVELHHESIIRAALQVTLNEAEVARPSLAAPPENLDVLLARLSDHLSPAEKRELLDAAEELRRFAYLREHWDDFTGTTWREPAKHLDAAIDAAMKRQSEREQKK